MCIRRKDGNQKKEVASLERMTLRLSGMRFYVEYEILPAGGEMELTEYEVLCRDGASVREPRRRATLPEEAVLKLVNDVRLLSWDGFHGRHPKGVKDGTMFRMEACVNGGTRIFADGSQNFPKGFHELQAGLDSVLREKK